MDLALHVKNTFIDVQDEETLGEMRRVSSCPARLAYACSPSCPTTGLAVASHEDASAADVPELERGTPRSSCTGPTLSLATIDAGLVAEASTVASSIGCACADTDVDTLSSGFGVEGDFSVGEEQLSIDVPNCSDQSSRLHSMPLTKSLLEAVLSAQKEQQLFSNPSVCSSRVDGYGIGYDQRIVGVECASVGTTRTASPHSESRKRKGPKVRPGVKDDSTPRMQNKTRTKRQPDEDLEEPQETLELAASPNADAGVDAELTEHNKALTRMSLRLQQGIRRGDPVAFKWAQLLDESVDLQRPSNQREVRLRALYAYLYGHGCPNKLPACPYPMKVRSRAHRCIAKNIENLHITLQDLLGQIDTQVHPGVFLLLSCHLGREHQQSRMFAWSDFPLVTLGGLLLVIGLLCEHFKHSS